MNSSQEFDTHITSEALRELGFLQIETSSFSNGNFDLILSEAGDAILYAHTKARSISYIDNMNVLQSFVNYTIITSIGISRQ
jgi:hypothetical protein